MPMLVLTGEKASGEFLITQGKLVADNVEGVIIKGSGHWLIDEEPNQTIPRRSLSSGNKRIFVLDVAVDAFVSVAAFIQCKAVQIATRTGLYSNTQS